MKYCVCLAVFLLATSLCSPAGPAPDVSANFHVVLPAASREFPEPLPAGARPGFRFRGTKGWAWTPQQYLAEIPFIAQCKMNFLMNCYISMFDIEHHAQWYDGDANRWWEELPAAKKTAYEAVVRSAQAHGLQFCFSMNPNLFSRRVVNGGSPGDVDLLFKHYAWMQSLGVKWFNLSLDDATNGIDAAAQARVCNEIFHRLRARDPKAQMIFCPTYYWGDGTLPKQRPYLEQLAPALDPEIYVFWTGDAVDGPVTRRAAGTFRGLVKHRMFLWDNYPVNDGHPTLNLGPVVGRDPDLCEVVDGYMSNPMREQDELNRIPLATCADYAFNPAAYDPARSIGQAILLQAGQTSQREVLAELVDRYPGLLIAPGSGHNPGFNPVRAELDHIMTVPDFGPAAKSYVADFQNLVTRFKTEFPDRYAPEKATLDADVAALTKRLALQNN